MGSPLYHFHCTDFIVHSRTSANALKRPQMYSKKQNDIDLHETVKARLEALSRLKKRKRHPFRSKLSRYASEIFLAKDVEGASYETIVTYLWKYHRLKTYKNNVRHFYLKVKNEAEATKSVDSYFAEPGIIEDETN